MRHHLLWITILLSGCGGSTTDTGTTSGNGNAGAGGEAGSGQAGQGGAAGGQAGAGQGGAGMAGAGQAGSGASCPAECHHGCTYTDKKCGQSTVVQGECIPTTPTPGCGDVQQPVCGCDGKVYANPCLLSEAGLDSSQLGNCAAPAEHFACGEYYCKKGAEYCAGNGSDVGTFASSYTCKPIPAACGAPGGAPCACFANEPCGMFCEASPEGDVRVICPGG